MNLRVSISCYIFSIYLAFFARCLYLSQNRLDVHRRNTSSRAHTFPDERVKKLAEVHVLFNLYTKKNPFYPQLLEIDSTESVLNSHFKSSESTIFITYGWTNGASGSIITSTIMHAYLEGKELVNVIVVDWDPLSLSSYHRWIKLVENVGIEVARMIDFLRNNAKLRLNSTTLVGDAQGAHIMGVAGKKITVGQVNQIFGLDPARRHFKNPNMKIRLSKSSARNVQVIHTNGNQLGLLQPLGHADFYPNGGSNQPACADLDSRTKGACSHNHAFWIFAESLYSPIGFKAIRCRSGENPYKGQCCGKIVLMGGRSNQINASGRFYLETDGFQPHALQLRRNKNKTFEYFESCGEHDVKSRPSCTP